MKLSVLKISIKHPVEENTDNNNNEKHQPLNIKSDHFLPKIKNIKILLTWMLEFQNDRNVVG